MSEISRFYGIVVRMYHNDHSPPHFHARYAELRASINVETGGVIRGKMPRRALALIQKWRLIHKKELLADWSLSRDQDTLHAIEPLR